MKKVSSNIYKQEMFVNHESNVIKQMCICNDGGEHLKELKKKYKEKGYEHVKQ